MKTQRILGAAVLPAMLAVSVVPTTATAQGSRIRIPEDTVVRVRMDDSLNGRSAREGERVMASVDRDDRSGFPIGTRFEGVVTEARRAADRRPGLIDMEFRRAMLPDREWIPVNGRLSRLAGDEVRRGDFGRLEARRGSGGNQFNAKWIGYGAAGGAVLGVLLGGDGKDWLKGALLGALGGAAYGYINRDRDRGRDYGDFGDVNVGRGTEFGVRLDRSVSFADRNNYRYAGDVGRYRERYDDRYDGRSRDRYDERYDDRSRDRYDDRYDDRYGSRSRDRYDSRATNDGYKADVTEQYRERQERLERRWDDPSDVAGRKSDDIPGRGVGHEHKADNIPGRGVGYERKADNIPGRGVGYERKADISRGSVFGNSRSVPSGRAPWLPGRRKTAEELKQERLEQIGRNQIPAGYRDARRAAERDIAQK